MTETAIWTCVWCGASMGRIDAPNYDPNGLCEKCLGSEVPSGNGYDVPSGGEHDGES